MRAFLDAAPPDHALRAPALFWVARAHEAAGAHEAAAAAYAEYRALGTPLEPKLEGHVLMLEDVGEYMYRIDRYFYHVTSNDHVRRCAGIRLGRCSAVPKNDPDFVLNEEEVARFWCERSGIPYLGRADIGHDSENKVVPFG